MPDWRDREGELLDKQAQEAKSRYGDMQTQGMVARALTDDEKLNEIFTYHPATPFTGPKFEHLREAAKHFAKTILLTVPPGADRTCALRHVRDAVMTANAGVALDGLSF